ncbi:type ISP restriction/modification enzyme [Psychrobacter proteolyticus]|uniref:type ISP restriction/modification enzyme n=1 Tax=Psychrobacter proteolyticus TaxID=147825 RepID=UPI000E0B64B7|nr:type ISP restriction/modification enzyme [Psychrobacter proteolyticus]
MSDSNHHHISDYLNKVASRVKQGGASEHTFRTHLEVLINALVPDVVVTNEPKQATECGNPDYLVSKESIPIGFIEAKDVGKDLGSKLYIEQFDRYKAALDNLIITDYTVFEFYEYGELINTVRLAYITEADENYQNSLVGNEYCEENYSSFIEALKKFCGYKGQTIKSAQRLAIMMAGKARLLENILHQALTSDEDSDDNSDLRDQFNTFKNVLIHDLTPKAFADIYAQTLAYGMFAARLNDDTLDTFSRQEAAELIPKTNPFLRKLFSHVAGVDIDDRIKLTVDNLADVFRATDVAAILQNFGKTTQTQDPIIHFYETFLKKYDPELRKGAGVYYTPKPVVQFIVRAVDDILKSEFDLPEGIADTSKIEIDKETQTPDSRTKSGYKTVKELVHKVQIIDPATGTGTFLATIIHYIFHSKFENMGGMWSSYAEQDLLPRLHGFELLMASYAIAHLKLDMLLTETGYQPVKPKRLQVYLTNSLEEHNPDTGTIFAGWLSAEANEASAIKRDAPVMVVMGNPPYSGVSQNNGKWISNLIEEYKYIDGKHFNERKHWLNDDYVKFIRYGQRFVEKNGEGILAFINPHGFLDNPTFRGMRWNLLKTFDKIYTIDLHGNSNRHEVCPDGSIDENVFDIMQGVAITIFVKSGKKSDKELGEIYHYDLYGKRDTKYTFLEEHSLSEISFKSISYSKPNFFFNPKDEKGRYEYELYFKLDELFPQVSSGIVTMGDNFIIDEKEEKLINRISDFLNNEYTDVQLKNKYGLGKNYPKWINDNKAEISKIEKKATVISFRPFDNRFTVFDNKLLWRWRYEVMSQIINKDNLSLLVTKAHRDSSFAHSFITNKISEAIYLSSKSGSNAMNLPLYLYPEEGSSTRIPNLDPKIVADIAKAIGLRFTNEKEDTAGTFAPIDILDYIYAVLHSPTYRETYKEFLKIDFPRVPYPSDAVTFWQLVSLGGELRQIHLLESPKLATQIKALSLGYPISGDNSVTRKMIKASVGFEPDEVDSSIGKVWLNDTQYFTNVPRVAWEFYIGGYQPAQKWLKDRRERTLDHHDIKHYLNIIASLSLTNELVQQIDNINVVG